MGTVHRLSPAVAAVTTGVATAAYLVTLAGEEQAGTRWVYTRILGRLEREFGRATAVGSIGAEALAVWFAAQWGERSPSTWNVALDAVRSAARYWLEQSWVTADPSAAAPAQGTPGP